MTTQKTPRAAKLHAKLQVGLEPKPWRQVKAFLGSGLNRFNRSAVSIKGESEFIVSVRDPDGTLLGGYYVTLALDTAFLKWAFVDEGVRRAGIGRKLMAATEVEARKRGAKVLYLDTFSFQAKPFYEKLGFQVFGTLELGRQGIRRYWMSKRL